MSLRAAACALALWLGAAPLAAQTAPAGLETTLPALSTSQRALLKQHPVIRLGVEGEWPPIEYFDERGQYSGVLSSYMRTLEQRLGIHFELVRKASWEDMMQAFKQGEIDVLPALSKHPSYGPSAVFTDAFITITDGIIVRNNEPFVEHLSDLPKGKIIAAVQGYGSNERAVKNNPQLIVVPVGSTEEALHTVATGRADVAIASLASAYYLTQTLGLSNLKVAANYDESEQSLRLAIRSEHAQLMPVFNLALASILPGEHQAMRNLWIRVPTERGFSRETVWLWIVSGVTAMLLLAAWVTLLLRQRRENAKLLARAEAAENQFRALVNAVPAVFWTLSPRPGRLGRFDVFGGEHITIGDLGIRDTGPHFEHLGKLMLEEDVERFANLVQRHSKTLTPFQIEYCLTNPRTGVIGWAYLHALPKIENAALIWYGCTMDITRRKQLEQALEASRAQLEEIASGVPGALWQFKREPGGQQYYSYMSEGIVGITGRSPEETNRLMQDKSFASVHPDDLLILQGLMQKLGAQPGTIDEARYRLSTTDGRWKWVQVAARAMPLRADGAMVWNGVTLDATRQHEAENALHQMKLRIEEIANSFPGAIWQMQRAPQGEERFTYMSENIRSITGRGPETALNVPGLPFQVMHEEDRERVIALLTEGVQNQRATRADYRLMTASGELRWVTASSICHREPDGTIVWNGILIDASEQKQLEEQLHAAREKAETASRAKSQFLANMSHEIRTPMNAVIGLSHLAMTSETNPAQQVRIGKIYNAGKALLKLLNDILEYSRLDAGKFTPVAAAFDLHEIKGNLRLFNATSAEAKGLTFDIHCTPDTPMHWVGDATRIQQILLNLIANAIKFTDSGRVTLSVTHIANHAGLCFTVQDTGIGMTQQQMQRVFDAFEQAHGEIERRHGGSGLGLSIAHGLVQALGGRIEVESTLGKGTVFTVTLPLQISSPPANTTLPAEFGARLHKLAAHIRDYELMVARTALQALREMLSPMGRDQELDTLERLLASFDLEAAAVEVSQLQLRWGTGQ